MEDEAPRGWWETPGEFERVEVQAYPEEWLHLHGKAISGLRHSHPLMPGENPDEPWHEHEGAHRPYTSASDPDRRGVGAALYPTPAVMEWLRG